MSSDQQVIKNCFNCAEWLSAYCNLDKIIATLIKTSLSNSFQNDYMCVNWRDKQSPRRVYIGPS